MTDEYRNIRIFTIADVLEGVDYLFKTEYGSWLTEEMLKTHLLRQFNITVGKAIYPNGNQQLRITMEVVDVPGKEDEGIE